MRTLRGRRRWRQSAGAEVTCEMTPISGLMGRAPPRRPDSASRRPQSHLRRQVAPHSRHQFVLNRGGPGDRKVPRVSCEEGSREGPVRRQATASVEVQRLILTSYALLQGTRVTGSVEETEKRERAKEQKRERQRAREREKEREGKREKEKERDGGKQGKM